MADQYRFIKKDVFGIASKVNPADTGRIIEQDSSEVEKKTEKRKRRSKKYGGR